MNERILSAKRPIAVLLLALLAGCQSWHPTTVSARALVPEERPSSVRLTLTDGVIVTVKDPTLRNDSIVSAAADGESVALADVQSLEVERFSPIKSIGLAVLIVVGSLGWAKSVGTGGGTGDPGDGPLPKG